MSYLNDKIFIFGGSVNKESTNDFYSLDLLSSTWSNLSSIPDLPSKRQSHQSISHGSKMSMSMMPLETHFRRLMHLQMRGRGSVWWMMGRRL
jgi:hypothetical protein